MSDNDTVRTTDAVNAPPGMVSPDGYYVWTGDRRVPVMSPMGTRSTAPVHSSIRARIVQGLLGGWILAALLELFVVEAFFSLEFTSPSGQVVQLRWGVMSTLIAALLGIAVPVWLIPSVGRIVDDMRHSSLLRGLLGLWVSLFAAYVLADAILAEFVRGVPVEGPETRWPVLFSAAIGVAAATAGIVFVSRTNSALRKRRDG
jgi:hypothetical protein